MKMDPIRGSGHFHVPQKVKNAIGHLRKYPVSDKIKSKISKLLHKISHQQNELIISAPLNVRLLGMEASIAPTPLKPTEPPPAYLSDLTAAKKALKPIAKDKNQELSAKKSVIEKKQGELEAQKSRLAELESGQAMTPPSIHAPTYAVGFIDTLTFKPRTINPENAIDALENINHVINTLNQRSIKFHLCNDAEMARLQSDRQKIEAYLTAKKEHDELKNSVEGLKSELINLKTDLINLETKWSGFESPPIGEMETSGPTEPQAAPIKVEETPESSPQTPLEKMNADIENAVGGKAVEALGILLTKFSTEYKIPALVTGYARTGDTAEITFARPLVLKIKGVTVTLSSPCKMKFSDNGVEFTEGLTAQKRFLPTINALSLTSVNGILKLQVGILNVKVPGADELQGYIDKAEVLA